MRLVLDTNILIASLIKNSTTRSLLLSPKLELYLPEYALEEVEAHFSFIEEKGGIAKSELSLLLSILLERINMVSAEKILPFWKEGEKLIARVDKEDTPFVALALSFPNDGIWTNDEHFLVQQKVKIWKTVDILEFVKDSK